MREALLSRRLEQMLTKDEILYLYLNQIYFGHGAYGVQEAARTYFAKPIQELSLGEAAYLASAPKNPSRYNIKSDPSAAKERQTYVLKRMLALGWAEKNEVETEIGAMVPKPAPRPIYLAKAPHYTEYVKQQLVATYGEDALHGPGLTVYTGMLASTQLAAQAALRRGLENLTLKQGYPGATLRVEVDVYARYIKALHEEFEQRIERQSKYSGIDGEEIFIWDLANVSATKLAQEHHLRGALRLVTMNQGLRVTGIVSAIDSVSDTATVDLGAQTATLRLEDMEWAKRFTATGSARPPRDPSEILNVGDLVEIEIGEFPVEADAPLHATLVPVPKLQGALISMDPHTRLVRSVVGGYTQRAGLLNRATQSLRQPGSSFQPIVYAAGITEGLITPSSICADSPVVTRDQWTGEAWKPENYEDGRYDGNITYRTALIKSKNTCSVKLLERLGPDKVIELAHKVGIESDLPRNLTLALGTGAVKPVELCNAYSTIASGGLHAEPIFIRKIVDDSGNILADHRADLQDALDPAAAYVVTRMMYNVVQEGTGRQALVLERPLAGKTGTTNRSRDAWFSGFSPELVTTVWVGFDDNKPIGRGTGSSAALPIWVDFMGLALKNRVATEFPVPQNVVIASIDPNTGSSLSGAGSIEEAYVEGTEPEPSEAGPSNIFMAEDQAEFCMQNPDQAECANWKL
jgi:penicillin-binding protein 1A